MSFALGALVVLLVFGGGSEAQSRGAGCRTQNGQQGTCIGLQGCEPLRNLLALIRAGGAPDGSLTRLRNAICHFENNEPLVCCPSSPVNPQPNPVTRSPVSPPPGGVTNPTSLLPRRCGVRGLTDRIIDGQPAPLGGWPWMVVLRGNTGGRSSWFCGGTLISNRYVLTAAHCFKERLGVTLEFARIGEHNIRQATDCEFGECAPSPQDIPVEAIISHPSYQSPCSECNDIALLRLSRPAVLDPLYVTPICLPLNPERDMGYPVQDFQGRQAWAAGWGTTARSRGTPRIPSILQQVQLQVQQLPFCNRLKRAYPSDSMTLCAGGGGKDTCRGDSGGPLTLTNSDNTKHYLVGVTSLGPVICGAPDTQGLYSSVHYYLPWILSTLRP